MQVMAEVAASIRRNGNNLSFPTIVAAGKPNAFYKSLVEEATKQNEEASKKHQINGNYSAAFWSKYGRLPTSVNDDIIYLLPCYITTEEGDKLVWLFGDRYEVANTTIPKFLSANGEDVTQTLSVELQDLMAQTFASLGQIVVASQGGRGCSSHDNCLGFPTWFFFLPVICCLGGACYSANRESEVRQQTRAAVTEFIKRENDRNFASYGLELSQQTATFTTVDWAMDDISSTPNTDGASSKKSVSHSWELVENELRWMELRKLNKESMTSCENAPLASALGCTDPCGTSWTPQIDQCSKEIIVTLMDVPAEARKTFW